MYQNGQWKMVAEYEKNGGENTCSSKKVFGWIVTFALWVSFIIGVMQMLETGNGNWFLILGLVFWLIANWKIKIQTSEELL